MGSERRYIDKRARISGSVSVLSCGQVPILYLRGRYQKHLDRYIPVQTHLLRAASSCASLAVFWAILAPECPEIPSGFQDSPLLDSQPGSFPSRSNADRPRTKMFFSGNFFPLATLSSIDDHIFCSASPLLRGRSFLLISEVLGRPLAFCLRPAIIFESPRSVVCL